MELIKTSKELRDKIKSIKNKQIGFVPTMGALHDGHLSLIKKAREQNGIVIVSIFVNPTQFTDDDDLKKYPKEIKNDMDKCNENDVDIVFAPENKNMYGVDEVLIKAPNVKSYILEGLRRPSHFDGVLRIVLKLLNLTKANNVYFGKKDAQQLLLIQNMVEDIFLDTNIIACDTIREKDGLAMSSRNIFLSKKERNESLKIYKSLMVASNMIEKNITSCFDIVESMKSILSNIEIEYVSIVNKKLQKINIVEKGNTIIVIAVKIGDTRLIDNIWM